MKKPIGRYGKLLNFLETNDFNCEICGQDHDLQLYYLDDNIENTDAYNLRLYCEKHYPKREVVITYAQMPVQKKGFWQRIFG